MLFFWLAGFVSLHSQNNGFHSKPFSGLAASDTSEDNGCFHKQINYSPINSRDYVFINYSV